MNPTTPQKWAGTLILPPTSDPIPKGLKLAATKPASPPVDPPHDLPLFQGFSASPYMLFLL